MMVCHQTRKICSTSIHVVPSEPSTRNTMKENETLNMKILNNGTITRECSSDDIWEILHEHRGDEGVVDGISDTKDARGHEKERLQGGEIRGNDE